MESVEVWMWVVAGLVIGSIVFSGGYIFLADYLQSSQINQAQKNFNSLVNSINFICSSGTGATDSKDIVFPFFVDKIFVRDETTNIEGNGRQVCIQLKNKGPECVSIDICKVNMGTIKVEEKTSIFNYIQEGLGKRNVADIKFNIQKESADNIKVEWKRQYIS